MTKEQQDAEITYMKMTGLIQNKNAGRIVITKTGLIGRTYNYEDLVNGKVKVYTDKGNLLCDPSTLKVTGFID